MVQTLYAIFLFKFSNFVFVFANYLDLRFAVRLPCLCCGCSEESWRGLLIQSSFIYLLTFLTICSIQTHKCLILQIIRKGFYETKHVEHKGTVWFFIFNWVCHISCLLSNFLWVLFIWSLQVMGHKCHSEWQWIV